MCTVPEKKLLARAFFFFFFDNIHYYPTHTVLTRNEESNGQRQQLVL